MHHYDDDPERFLPATRPGFVSLTCPDCPQVVTGLDAVHAAELLAIHQEGTCQGGREVGSDGDDDPDAPDAPADALRVRPRQ